MIDVEVDIFDAVYPFIAPLVPEGNFSSEFDPTVAALPYAVLYEMDNFPDRHTADTGNKEWSDVLTYEARVYSRSKTECRAIMSAMDSAMIGLIGFTKLSGQYVPNLANGDVHQYIARYERGVTQTGDLYKPR